MAARQTNKEDHANEKAEHSGKHKAESMPSRETPLRFVIRHLIAQTIKALAHGSDIWRKAEELPPLTGPVGQRHETERMLHT